MLKFKITNKKLHNVQSGVAQGIINGIDSYLIILEGQASANAPGPRSTGALRASIKRQRKGKTGKVYSDLVYSAIQEFGGIIRATRAKFLRFQTKDGTWHMKKSVKIPAANNGKGYMRYAVDQTKNRLTAIFGKDIRISIKRN
jgi:hypothetical protein